jgi:hypothetical protein
MSVRIDLGETLDIAEAIEAMAAGMHSGRSRTPWGQLHPEGQAAYRADAEHALAALIGEATRANAARGVREKDAA